MFGYTRHVDYERVSGKSDVQSVHLWSLSVNETFIFGLQEGSYSLTIYLWIMVGLNTNNYI